MATKQISKHKQKTTTPSVPSAQPPKPSALDCRPAIRRRKPYQRRGPAPSKPSGIIDQIRQLWFVFVAISGIVYWAAKHDAALLIISDNKTRIGLLESRIIVLESGLEKIRVQIDGIRDDLLIIKGAVVR